MKERLDLVYFTDRDLGKQLPALLEAAGMQVERHSQYFEHDTPDHVWLEAVAQRGWVVLTHDQRIRYSPLAVDVLIACRGRVVILVAKKLPHSDLAALVVERRKQMERFVTRQPAPFMAKLRRDGMEMWLSSKDARRRKKE